MITIIITIFFILKQANVQNLCESVLSTTLANFEKDNESLRFYQKFRLCEEKNLLEFCIVGHI